MCVYVKKYQVCVCENSLSVCDHVKIPGLCVKIACLHVTM